MTDEQKLLEKLRQIEALFAAAVGPGDRADADAVNRVLNRTREVEQSEPAKEYRFTFRNRWSQQLFTALLHRYHLRPYRYSGQRYTTLMARVTKRFVDDILWPEFQKLNQTLELFLDEVAQRVIAHAISEEGTVVEVLKEEPKQLPGPDYPNA